ncbi:protein SHI RELATED SEQUENCE 1-like [Amaranthus tricolor]|uniref:protein SHI RELATED SEQUENCE 1-like n=1 Tax=Amaranthus tricolor TaxID=29722 RepID=UPI0025861CBE|nr:protein SHI RELATED SEQUENCE 1-like [Amaranthus tricolor]
MAGFFSLDSNTNTDNSYLWHHHHHHHQPPLNLSISAVDFQGGNDITRSEDNSNNLMMMMRMSSSSSGGSISCQDCGNQAKKDCVYMRCRTCCKSRGFDCATHVRSTWVPASVRRERHQKLVQHLQHQQEQDQEQMGIGASSKRRRDHTSSLVCTQLPATDTNTNTTTSFSGPMEVGNFPAELSYPATFRCVKVSSIDDSEDEYAYQTAVNIGGHVFKGILYDQGPGDHHDHPQPGDAGGSGGGESSSVGGNLTMGPTISTSGTLFEMPISSSSPVVGYLDPSSYYPLPVNAYLPPGTPFFPYPRP